MTTSTVQVPADSYVSRSLTATEASIKLAQEVLSTYWTPFEGHKVSKRSTLEKIKDLLVVATSGQRSAVSETEELQWFAHECQLLGIRADVLAKA